MTDYTKLVKELRGCKDMDYCTDCPRMANGYVEFCNIKDDAAAAIEALQADNKGMLHELEDAAKQIRELQDEVLSYASGSQPHWVSVEDELPAKRRIVIACNECEIVQCAYLEDNERWYAANNQTWDSWTYMPYVTHWMPLPEPPQEVQDGQ